MASERVRATLAPLSVSVYSQSSSGEGQHGQDSVKQMQHSVRSSRRLSGGDLGKKGVSAPSPSKKRRSQSMGGALTEAAAARAAAASAVELSPRSEWHHCIRILYTILMYPLC